MPHKEEGDYVEFTPDLYPPFPEDIPTVELQTITLSKLLDGEAAERDRVFDACTGRGFFYLALDGCDVGETILHGAGQIALAGERVFKLPLEDKMHYKMAKTLFGYKHAGATKADKGGVPDTAEFFNVSKNDMIVPNDQMSRPWPSAIMEKKSLFADYIQSAHSVGLAILAILAEKLGIDSSEFANRHRIGELSGDHIRLTRGPPRETEELPEIQTPSHTDFGTITILMNWLGGLQVWSESSRRAQLGLIDPDVPGEWLWVKPKRGCAIINLGDAAVRFTNSVLCSGRHRVIPSPGAQGRWPRYSVVYFVRPEDQCVMKRLKGKGIPKSPEEEGEELTAHEWIFRQASALGNRFDN